MSDQRLDEIGAGVFLNRRLEQVLPKIYEKKYPNLWAANGLWLPATGDLEMGVETIVAESQEYLGEATIFQGEADDIPLADAGISEDKYKAVGIIAGFRYTIPELNAAEKGNRPLTMMRENAMKRALAEKEHILALFGSVKHDMAGMFSCPDIPKVISSDNLYDPAVTGEELADFIIDNFIKVEEDSLKIESPNTLMVPIKLHSQLIKKRITNTSMNAKQYILEKYGIAANSGTIKDIVAIPELASTYLEKYGAHAAGTNKDRIMLHPNDPESIERKFYSLDILTPQLRGLEYRVIGISGTSEFMAHYPGSCLYVDIPKAA